MKKRDGRKNGKENIGKYTKPIPRYHRNEPDAYDPQDYLYDYTTSYMLARDRETSPVRYAVSRRGGVTRTFARRPHCTCSLSTRIGSRVGGRFFLRDILLWDSVWRWKCDGGGDGRGDWVLVLGRVAQLAGKEDCRLWVFGVRGCRIPCRVGMLGACSLGMGRRSSPFLLWGWRWTSIWRLLVLTGMRAPGRLLSAWEERRCPFVA